MVDARWTRLEAMLTALKPGDAVSVDQVIAATDLPRELVATVLSELARLDLFARRDDTTFERRSLWEDSV